VTDLRACVEYLDGMLQPATVPDYDQALNGLQLENNGTVTHVATAVDFSRASVDQALAAGADLLIVHHGMFWGEPRRIIGARYARLRAAIAGNLAVYASHLPLDLHPTVGNNVRLAETLGLTPSEGFGKFQTIMIGVAGSADLETTELAERLRSFAAPLDTHLVTTPIARGRRTTRWAILTGAGASSSTLREAVHAGVDTLIVGEGPHHTAVEAPESDLVVMYAGHYATETLGVQALGAALERQFSLPWSFLHLPTGL
jgi:dinuclear metal center YbgI/SA1388 family protein